MHISPFHQLLKKKIKNILEIGIGGHADKYEGGLSILALKQFFPNSKIIGVDIIEKKFLESKRVKTIKLDQSNSKKLKEMAKLHGKFDLIIDDGSHFCDHQRKTFLTLFEFLNDEDFYIVEDINNSYKVAGGGSPELDYEKNNLTFFKDLVHAVNSNFLHKEIYKNYNEFINIDKFLFFPGIIILQKKLKKLNQKQKNIYTKH
jgi:23S rRNA U2552 (ribose-2'-O)-methylase RlmE/FtsJ